MSVTIAPGLRATTRPCHPTAFFFFFLSCCTHKRFSTRKVEQITATRPPHGCRCDAQGPFVRQEPGNIISAAQFNVAAMDTGKPSILYDGNASDGNPFSVFSPPAQTMRLAGAGLRTKNSCLGPAFFFFFGLFALFLPPPHPPHTAF